MYDTHRIAGPHEGVDRGHRTVPHTADLRIEAWGPTREEFIADAVPGPGGQFRRRRGPAAVWPGQEAHDSRASKPVVLVPPGAKVRRPAISRVLLPLDGTPESAAAVAGTMGLLARAGVDLVVLHVFDAATVPRFWDQAAHAHRAWAEEFLARNAAAAGARLELRSGSPGEQVVEVAGAEQADLIALGWSQHLDAGRSRTVRRSVLHAGVPVLLVPAGGG